MNPYVSAGLVMCAVLFIALAMTAYMAVFFNRRSKADLDAALQPLAGRLDGEVDLEDASVEGRYDRRLVLARVTRAEGGPVRVFRIDMVDPAGGGKWLLVSFPPKKGDLYRTEEFESDISGMRGSLKLLGPEELARAVDAKNEWFQLEYNPEGGYIRLTMPMDTRKDIPGAELFGTLLSLLAEIAQRNRQIQQLSVGAQERETRAV